MRAVPRACLAVVLAVPLTACAARMPAPETFAVSDWAAVRALQPGTRVEVRYLMGTPRPLRYSFTGDIESVDAAHLVLRTREGRHRLLAERVLRVARMMPGGNRMGLGAVIGAAAGVLWGAWFAGEDYKRPDSMRVMGGIGALLGASLGGRIEGETRHVLYERR